MIARQDIRRGTTFVRWRGTPVLWHTDRAPSVIGAPSHPEGWFRASPCRRGGMPRRWSPRRASALLAVPRVRLVPRPGRHRNRRLRVGRRRRRLAASRDELAPASGLPIRHHRRRVRARTGGPRPDRADRRSRGRPPAAARAARSHVAAVRRGLRGGGGALVVRARLTLSPPCAEPGRATARRLGTRGSPQSTACWGRPRTPTLRLEAGRTLPLGTPGTRSRRDVRRTRQQHPWRRWPSTNSGPC